MTSRDSNYKAQTCPACGGDNRCAVAQNLPPASCWCFSVAFNKETVARFQGKEQCLCQRCGTAATQKEKS
ncbi:cysteine-rich CWC family protein [Litorivivens sp.]|uniref:cysteine-rich CWC family protein n=1 Tax=Litorivivens sp. TaxID=2020868 RepID=UPI00356A0F99